MDTEKKQCRIHTVSEADLASSVKSGSMPVLATPVLICWLEQLCFEMLQDEGVSVGYDLSLKHLKPSFLKEPVKIEARIVAREKNHVTFALSAFNSDGALAAKGEHKRAFINPDTFLHADR